MGVSENRGVYPKMDGEKIMDNPIFNWDDLGIPIIFGNTHIYIYIVRNWKT